MKKKVIIPGLLTAAAVVSLTSCGDDNKAAPSVVDLEISGYTENFTVGDTFTKGSLKVEAKYDDDSKVDVTNDVKVDAPTSLSEPGTYAVIVSYGNFSEAYQIKVASNSQVVAVLKELKVTGAKDSFVVGDEFVTTGLKVEALYDDDTKTDVTSSAKVSGPTSLDKAGTYAVVVSYGGMNAVYQVNVASKVSAYSSVQEALEVGLENQSKVKSGTSKSRYSTYAPNVVDFEYGLDEYIKLTTYDGENVSFIEHFFPYDTDIIGIQSAPDWEDSTKFVDSKIGGASEFNLWGSNFYTFQNYEETVMDENDKELKPYGTVGILKYLYKLGQKDQEGFDEVISYSKGKIAYSFGFSIGSTDYSVSFMLDDSGAITNVYATANEYSLEIEQTVGTRDLALDYDVNELIVKEFTLLDPEQSKPVELVDGAYHFTMEIDALLSFGFKANDEFKGDWLCDAVEVEGSDFETLYSYYNEEENAVKFRAYCAGTYTITISTANCELKVVVTVPQVAPDAMNAKPFYANEDNPNLAQFGSYITAPQKVALDSNFYFVGAPTAFGKEANTDGRLYSVEIVSANKEDAKLELVNCDYADQIVPVYCLKANAAGTYTILVKSTYEGCEAITKTFDVEVIDTSNVNVANIFTGTYS
ncbi:MAG: bacterial Ig-like domain-containing protein [Anaeroplasmataceae bacterium]|nr:bacterial Ig-like domain-containing protein [Anaeroplasmataceae bacterium]